MRCLQPYKNSIIISINNADLARAVVEKLKLSSLGFGIRQNFRLFVDSYLRLKSTEVGFAYLDYKEAQPQAMHPVSVALSCTGKICWSGWALVWAPGCVWGSLKQVASGFLVPPWCRRCDFRSSNGITSFRLAWYSLTFTPSVIFLYESWNLLWECF